MNRFFIHMGIWATSYYTCLIFSKMWCTKSWTNFFNSLHFLLFQMCKYSNDFVLKWLWLVQAEKVVFMLVFSHLFRNYSYCRNHHLDLYSFWICVKGRKNPQTESVCTINNEHVFKNFIFNSCIHIAHQKSYFILRHS